MVRAALAVIGLDVVIGYGVFAAIGLFVALLPAGGFLAVDVTLADLLSGDLAQVALDGVSGRGVFLVLLATATIAVPVFWRRRLATLAYAVPLMFTLAAFWPLYVQQRRQQEAIRAMGELGQGLGELAQQMNAQIAGPLANLRVAAWLLFAMVLFLALRGVMRTLASR